MPDVLLVLNKKVKKKKNLKSMLSITSHSSSKLRLQPKEN